MLDIEKMLEAAVDAAIEAGKKTLEIYHQGRHEVVLKTDRSPVTAADRASQEIIIGHLLQTSLPVISEESETADAAVRRSWEYCWIVDPLDGTKEFISGSGEFTVNIALIHKDRPIAGVVYVPYTDALYAGAPNTGVYKLQAGSTKRFETPALRTRFEDISVKSPVRVVASRLHMSPETTAFIRQFPNAGLVTAGSSLKFMLLLEGTADIYPRLGRTMEWDTAAAHAILNAANRGVYRQDLRGELIYNKPDLSNPYFISF